MEGDIDRSATGATSSRNDTSTKSLSLIRQRVFGGLWVGSTASSVGSSAGLVAINWLVYTVTGSAFDIALVGVAGVIPRVIFGIFSGALADRYNKLRLMIFSSYFRAATMVLLAAALVLYGFQLSLILAAVFVLGLGQSLFRPAINSLLPTASPKDARVSFNNPRSPLM